MSTGWRFTQLGGAVFALAAVLCAGSVSEAQGTATQTSTRHKAKKKNPPPPLPSGPTGPVQQIPLDSIASVPPQVSFHDNQLTIVAPNSTLGDILRAVRKQTGADIDVPSAPEHVVTHLGPGPARDVLSDLLNGSRFNYVLLGSPGNETVLTRVVLVPKATQQAAASNPTAADSQPGAQPGSVPAPEQEAAQDNQDNPDAEATEENNADDNGDQQQQPAEAQQSQNAPEQPNVKTPQQMLQEMQQRQMMMQGQQQPGQAVPGSGMPPHPPPQQQ